MVKSDDGGEELDRLLDGVAEPNSDEVDEAAARREKDRSLGAGAAGLDSSEMSLRMSALYNLGMIYLRGASASFSF